MMHKLLPKHFKYENYIVTGCIALLLILLGGKTNAQSLGDAVVKITFGSGTATRGGALSADSGATTYTYSSGGEIGENYYTITNLVNTAVHGGFVTSYDHGYETTGKTDGYMMVVNGNIQAGTVFTRKVSNLCGNTQYQFGVWIKNVLSTSGIAPNMVFHIYTADGLTELSNPIATGDVPTGNVWHNYTANFTLPAGTGDVLIKLVSNASGTVGNDFAVDDITFSPYGSTVSAVFDGTTTGTETTCAGSAQTYTIKATSTLASGYIQKLQMYVNGVWTDLGPASTQTTFSVTAPTTAGTYLYRLVSSISDNISSANCVVASNQLTVKVEASPTPAFTAPAITCLGNVTSFTDNTVATGTTITGWLWDFGDGTPASSLQNPTHTYTTAGDKTVKLTITNANGCVSVATPKTIHISTPPKAVFTYLTPDCVTKAVTFTDASTAAEDAITSWLWDYGDGTTETRTDKLPFQHTYTAAGPYTVTLAVKTATAACPSSVSHSFTVGPLPVVDFIVPGVCLQDTYAVFTDNSTIADGSALSYSWDFGDATNPHSVNTSILKNPQHSYAGQGIYNVSLTVTSAAGCSVTTVKQLTVNGANPKAAFTALNAGALCSDRTVDFQNQSTVDFGNITKIDIYFDSNDLTAKITDNAPTSGKIYSYKYPEFHTPGTKTYMVTMIAYSGTSCANSITNPITLFATPDVSLKPQAAICYDGGTIQLSATQTGVPTITSGTFSGTGVTAGGLFDPTVSGVGTFTIQYNYTSSNGCTNALSQDIIVNTSPVVNGGGDLVVLEGGSVKINATATPLTDVTYSWYPTTYLSDATVLNPTVTPKADISYVLTVKTDKGCSSSAKVNVTILKNPVIPNTFTPNGDSVNDTWSIKYLASYPDCTVNIFNRNGQKVFNSIGYPIPWNGRYNGVDLPIGTYYYIIDPKMAGQKIYSGSVTIIR